MTRRDPRADPADTAASTTGASSLAFLRAIAHVPEVIPEAADPRVDESGSCLAAGEDPPRFELGRWLGSGGFGTVYEAVDRKRGATVALKVLRRTDAQSIYLFKQEFRALAGLVHRHLVRLYELHQDGDRWFFTMEVVHGDALIAGVRRGDTYDEPALRAAFRQLVQGLAFLHDAGKLHRDVKPSNVMVDAGGTVKILDFGLVAELAGEAPAALGAGTPSYMAPEQAAGLAVGPPTDLYAVGVMLHEALTGRLPPRGEPPSAPDAPGDLAALCRDLLARDPAARPSAREVITRLTGEADPIVASQRSAPAPTFVGRAVELARLDAALDDARAGRPTVALVHGSSGIGKSALVQRFLASLRDAPAVITLAGRCFQQESVPYKALDSLVDALGRRLARAAPDELAAWLPDDPGALGRAFPVLRQVPAIAAAASAADADAGETDLRHRAFAAVRALFTRMAGAHTLVLVVDDLQWGDLDSVALIVELLHPPAAPPLLFVAAYRAEAAASSPVLRELGAALADELAASVRVHEIALGELLPDDAAALAGALLAGAPAVDPGVPARLAAEAHNSPFFLTELARWTFESGAHRGDAPDLPALLAARVARLPAPARRLLEVVSVAGQPIPRAIAVRAAQADGEAMDEPETLSRLFAGQMVRAQDESAREAVAPYHDRIREAVLAGLSVERRREHHARLARSLEAAGGAEPSLLVHHLREAGLAAEAATYALTAAEQARAALAFDQAARLFREALALGGLDDAAVRRARHGLAGALAGAGRPHDAAEAYLDLAAREPPREAHAHRRIATQLLLAGGYVDEGLASLDGILAEIGVKRPASTLEALGSLAALRARLRVRGLAFRERPEREIPERELLAIDACFVAASSLAVVAPFQVAPFQARHLLLALDAGEPLRLVRAFTLAAISAAIHGGQRDVAHTEALLERLEGLTARFDRPEVRGLGALARGVAGFVRGEVGLAEPLLIEGIAAVSAHVIAGGAGVELGRGLLAISLWVQGKIAALGAMTTDLLADARERGNRYRATMIRLNSAYLLDLAADRPAEARATVDAAMERWSRAGYHLQHLRELIARTQIALYEGDGRAAFRRMVAGIPPLFQSGLVAMPVLRAQVHHIRALAALAAAARGGPGAPVLYAVARHDARSLARGDVRWGPPMASLLGAVADAQRRRPEDAVTRLRAAAEAFDEMGFALFAAAARRLGGAWIGGDEGAALVALSDAWMKARGIQSPARLTAMIAGGAA